MGDVVTRADVGVLSNHDEPRDPRTRELLELLTRAIRRTENDNVHLRRTLMDVARERDTWHDVEPNTPTKPTRQLARIAPARMTHHHMDWD